MTPQEIFTAAYKAVIAQGEPAIYEFGSCFYANKDRPGIHCAVGLLMNAEERERFGNFPGGVVSLAKSTEGREHLRPFFLEHAYFLAQIQRAHDLAGAYSVADDVDFVEKFKENMAVVAEHNNLDVPAD